MQNPSSEQTERAWQLMGTELTQGRWADIAWWILVGTTAFLSIISAAYSAIIVDIIAIILLPVLLSARSLSLLKNEKVFLYWLIAFIILGLSFAITAEQWSDMRFLFNFLPFLLSFPVFVIGRRLTNHKAIMTVLLLLLGGAAVSVIVGVFDLFVRDLPRSEGYLSGALVIARLGMMFGFVASAGYFIEKGARRYLYLAGPLLGLVSILLASGRGAMLVFPFLATLLLLFIIFDTKQKHRWAIVGVVFGTGVVLATVAFLFLDTARLLNTFGALAQAFSGDSVHDGSIQQRMDFYAAGWQLFMQSPWIGYGWADIPRMAFTILDLSNYSTYSLDFFDFHNDFLNFAVASGIVGVFVLFVFLLAPIVSVWTSQRDTCFWPRLYGISVIVTTYLLSGLTDVSLGFDRYTTPYAMMVAIILGIMWVPLRQAK